MADYVIGIDLGATKIALGLIDAQDRIVDYRRSPTQAVEGPQAAVERMVGCIRDLEHGVPAGGRVAGIGVCCPGPLDHERGLLLDPPNLAGWRNVPLRQMLAERLGLPVVLEHDAKAAALGEYHYGSGQHETSMAYIVVGTGTGAAFILDGQLYRGRHNLAGEIGGVTIDRHEEGTRPMCGSGIRGCVQGYTCGPALAYHYRLLAQRAGQHEGDGVTGEQVAQLAAKGDVLALQVMTQAGEALGVAIASMAMILDVGLFVIGGSVVKAGDLLLEPARQIVPHYAFESVAAHVSIVAAGLGDDGPILGSGWLARQALLQ